jgi:hypothetical protein
MGDQAEGSERTSGDRSFWTIRVGLGVAIVVLIAGGVMWRLQATPPAVSPSPVPSHSPLTPLSDAHVIPRYATEPPERRRLPAWFYDWDAAPRYDAKAQTGLRDALRNALQGDVGQRAET